MQGVRLLVSGRVQGVGFRVYTKRLADQLGITGAVWNTRHGHVEILAGHPTQGVLESFVKQVSDGPGYVQDVARTDLAVFEIDPGFEVRATV